MKSNRKQLILRMLERLDDNVSYDQVIYHLSVMKDVEIGLDQVARGEVIDDDELFGEFQGEDEAEKTSPSMNAS